MNGGTAEGLSAEELKLIVMFLETAAGGFEQHGCNDFMLPATAENKAIFVAVLEHRYARHAGEEQQFLG
jgi:hypothetical protein